ncbi:hypothetical protein SAMN05216556_11951 [Aequorivita viscosa]|nr:hypothetical protein SAMN05216556_11951 [Aequorivita viscosa]
MCYESNQAVEKHNVEEQKFLVNPLNEFFVASYV